MWMTATSDRSLILRSIIDFITLMRLPPTPNDTLIAVFAQQQQQQQQPPSNTKMKNKDKTESKPCMVGVDDHESIVSSRAMPAPRPNPFAVKQDQPLGDLKQFYKKRLAAFRQVCPADDQNNNDD